MNNRIERVLQLSEYLEIEIRKNTPLLAKSELENPWFVKIFLDTSISTWAKNLNRTDLNSLLNNFNHDVNKKIGIVAAGNLPLVGLHDVIVCFLYGCQVRIKLSNLDHILMKKVIHFLDPEEKQIKIVNQLKNIDAVIATGSNNTFRYFEYYFRDLPKILRRNRTSVAIITEDVDHVELELLADDIFQYFGLGCRNVSKIFVPQKFEISQLLPHFDKYSWVINHNKFANNYMYRKAIWNMNLDPHWDNGFLLIKESQKLHAPISTLFLERYSSLKDLNFISRSEDIQCVVSRDVNHVDFGQSQSPKITSFADNIDTTVFLSDIK